MHRYGSYNKILAILFFALLSHGGALAKLSVVGYWEGAIVIPGKPTAITIEFTTATDDSLIGDISIQAQDLKDRTLIDLKHKGNQIQFAIPGIPGDPAFAGMISKDGESIIGNFKQWEGELPFYLKRGVEPVAKVRAALDNFGDVVQQALEDFNLPGAAFAVVHSGELVYAEGYGYRDIENKLPVTPDTLYAISTNTQAMTATVLGMLVDEGKLNWDEPLRNYIPTFRLSDTSVSERITTRDLLTHRSGLPPHFLVWFNDNKGSRAEMIERIAHLDLSVDLRQRFQISALMYMTAGYLAGQLTGSTWEETMRERLFEPLGMKRSNFSVTDSQNDDNHALPYHVNNDNVLERVPFRHLELIGPAGSVNSSVNEMSRWLLFNLNNGKFGEKRLIKKSTLVDIQTPHMTMGAALDVTPKRPEISATVVGMGWDIDTYRGHKCIFNRSGIDGFTSSVMLFPDDDLGIVFFTNRRSFLPAQITQTAVDRILGFEPIDWLGEAYQQKKMDEIARKEAENKKEMLRISGTKPSHQLSEYTGDYHHPGYGSLKIDNVNEAMELTINGMTPSLEHWHYDVWNSVNWGGDSTVFLENI